MKVGLHVRVQLPDCSPQGLYDMYSQGEIRFLTREVHACVCFSVGPLNHVPGRPKLSMNLQM